MADLQDTGAAALSLPERQLLVAWAARAAAGVLEIFEEEQPDDTRPRRAIQAAERFAAGHPGTGGPRSAADAAHEASLPLPEGPARWAAKAAGHAAGTVAVPANAGAVVLYLRKIAPTAVPDDGDLPDRLRLFLDPQRGSGSRGKDGRRQIWR